MLRARAERGLAGWPPWQDSEHHSPATQQLLAAPVWLRPGKRGDVLVDPQRLHLSALGADPAPAEGWPADMLGAPSVLLRAAAVSPVALRRLATPPPPPYNHRHAPRRHRVWT